jgi:REP element-mobilizing transposase RayT/DNA-binding CsgD family transcriptional regulator
MSRAWRIEYEGAYYHLLSRGNEGGDIFVDKDDRFVFLDTLGEMSERFEMDVYAYVLMDNHYHLLVRTRQANLKKAMHWFGTTYTHRYNRRHFRSGHLFQGRYKSIIVQNDAYLLQLSYYIHRNPLRAGMVKRLADYRWSSYRIYGYGKKPPDWLTTELILSHFRGLQDKHKNYREKVQRYAKEEKHLFEDLRHGLILGSKQFVERIRKQYLQTEPETSIPQQSQIAKQIDPVRVLAKAQRILKCDVQHFIQAGRLRGEQKDNRDLIVYFMWRFGQLTNKQIGQLLGISYSAVSHVVKTLKVRMHDNPKLMRKLKQLNSQFKL